MTTMLSDLRVKLNLNTQKPTPIQYRSSIGDTIQLNSSLGFGRQAWEAIEKAKDVWHDKVESCIDAIQLHHYPEIFKGLSPPSISRRCWMIGPSRDFAHPTAVITCERKGVLQRFVRLISRDQIFRSTDFRIVTILSSTEILNGIAHLWVNPSTCTNTLSLPGAEVYSTRLNRRATLGGVVLVDDKLYGLTVAHVCTGEEFPRSANRQVEEKITFYDDLYFEAEKCDSHNDSGSIFSDYDDTQDQEMSGTDDTTTTASNASSIGPWSFGVHVPTTCLSSTHPLQPGIENEYDGFDWALFPLTVDRLKVNEVSFPSTAEQSQQHIFVGKVSIPNDLLSPKDATQRNLEPIQLWVVTSRGPIKAYSKAGSSTSVSFVNSHTFQKFWTVQLTEILKPGDSGSWVIDANTGDLYGVLIAQSELLEEGYVIQATDILQDICVKQSVRVRIPSAVDAFFEANKYGEVSLIKRLIHVAVEQKSLSDNNATIALHALVNNLPLSSWDEHLPLFTLVRNNGADTDDRDVLSAVSRVLAEFESDSKTVRGHEKLTFLDALLFLLSHRKSSDEPPLSWVIRQRHQRIAQLFLQLSDVEVNFRDKDGRTPLLHAVEQGNPAIVRLLLERDGIEVNLSDNKGRTPLSLAVEEGQETVVRLLLERDSIEVNFRDKDGRTPLLHAVEQGNAAIVRLLLEHDGIDINPKGKDGRTPLLYAAEQGYSAIVRLLLEHSGIDINPKGKDGRTPLSWAATKYDSEATVRLLLERQVRVDVEDNSGRTPLSWAAQSGQEKIVQLLLERHVGVDLPDSNGRTPLSYAAYRNEAVVRLVLEHNVRVDLPDNNGRSPLSWAAQSGQEKIVQLLLERHVRVDLPDSNGRTPLSWAVEYRGQATIVRLLLERNARVDLADNNGRTPLSWAAEKGGEAVVQLLLEHKDTNVNSKDKDGQTALSWAKREAKIEEAKKEARYKGRIVRDFNIIRFGRHRLEIVKMIKAHGGKDYSTEEEKKEEEESGGPSGTWMDWD